MLPVQIFDFGSSPRCSSQKLQAGFDAWIKNEALNLDLASQRLPAVVVYQLRYNCFQRDSVQRITVLLACRSYFGDDVLTPVISCGRHRRMEPQPFAYTGRVQRVYLLRV